MKKWRFKKIDWTNHTIGFASTIIGILIAFQLEDWRESREEVAKIKKAELSLVAELQRNRAGLENVVKENNDWLAYANFMFSHLYDDHLACTKQELDSIKNVYPERFGKATFVRKISRAVNLYNCPFEVDRYFIFQVETDAWEAAKSSGILNYLDQQRVFWYVKTYKEIERRLSTMDEREMMEKLGEQGSIIQLAGLVAGQTKGYEMKLHFVNQGLQQLLVTEPH
jgi:hypothetical protein